MIPVNPDGMDWVRQTVERLNREKSEMCLVCTAGKLYGPGEPVPYVVFDIRTAREEFPGRLVVTGTCTTCGSKVDLGFDLIGK
ncbi:hypothetical protein K2X33_16595 [bacterium]|nr:hypothetical protein [bacterium]